MKQIIKPLFRQRLMPLLVAMQVVIACAIACNALFLLQQRLAPIIHSHAVQQPERLIAVWQVVARGKPWSASRVRATTASLRALPGVASASAVSSLPMMTQVTMNGDVESLAGGIDANTGLYVGSDLVATLGLDLIAGRDFSATEEAVHYKRIGVSASGPAIITDALAQRLFPEGHALGKVIMVGDAPDPAQRTVVGVVAHLMRNDFGSGESRNLDYAMLYPGVVNRFPVASFAVRVGSGNPQQLIKSVDDVIERTLGSRMAHGIKPHVALYSVLRDQALAASRAGVWLMSGVTLIVLLVALAGIIGLTSYWVGQRTRQIGICRALGATRSQILHSLQIENLLVVGVGVVIGLVAAYGVNLWMVGHYQMIRMPWAYLPVGAVVLLALGQVGVLWPAIRASRVPPVAAMRSA